MAYVKKYSFPFQSVNGLNYEVRLLVNGYDGPVITRPLGKPPVIHMQDSGPIRATSVDLTLECQVDGEFAGLYTSDPRMYKIQIYRGTASCIWEGFVATELYSEPDIAPPYDVRVTATDGLGVLKEYQYETGWGGRTVREQLQQMLLSRTGLSLDLYTVSRLREYGETAESFIDEIKIDLDYHRGDSCYDVLQDLLTSMGCFITQWRDAWLIIRDTDVNGQIKSNGDVTVMESEYRGINDTYTHDMEDLTAKLGKMGASGTDMWPVGYMTRRIIPAKKSVAVKSEWHLKNGGPPLSAWTGDGDYASGSSYWSLGINGGTGIMAASMDMFSFRHDIKVTVKVSAQEWGQLYGYPWMKVMAGWVEGSTVYYFNIDDGWGTSVSPSGVEHRIDRTNWYNDPGVAETIEVTIPAMNTGNTGRVAINVQGHRVKVYDVRVELVTGGGYKDTILIGNGARGSAPEISILGGRQLSTNKFPVGFVGGVFYHNDGSSASDIITSFSDDDNSGKDFMTLAALNYAKSVADAKIEVSGNLDFPGTLTFHPLLLKSHNVWALVSSFDWDLYNSEYNFKAVTLPTATLVVDSETITPLE